MEICVQKGHGGAPHVVRLIPIQATCSAHSAAIICDTARPFVEDGLTNFSGSYAVNWRRRCNSSLDKMDVISHCAPMVQEIAPKAVIRLREPEAVLSLDIIKSVGCVSVLPRWRQFKEY